MDFPKDASSRSVFVSNIPYEASEQKLKDVLSEVGHVVSFRMIMDSETLKPKGFAFCEYEDSEIANSAIRNLNGREIFGRNLRIAPASNTDDRRGGKQTVGTGPPTEVSTSLPPVPPENAPEEITKAVNSIPTEQMFELMKQMKLYVQQQPEEARQLLLHNPQLAYALLQAQVIMRIVDPHQANDFLHKPRQPATVINPFPEFIEHQPNFEGMRPHESFHPQQLPRSQHEPQLERGPPPQGMGPVPMNIGGPMPEQNPMSFPMDKMTSMNPYLQQNQPGYSREAIPDQPHVRPQDPRTVQDVKPHEKQLFSPVDYPRMVQPSSPQDNIPMMHRGNMGMDTSQPLPPSNPLLPPHMGSDPRMDKPFPNLPNPALGPPGNVRLESPHDLRRVYSDFDQRRNPPTDISPRMPPNFAPHAPFLLNDPKQNLPAAPPSETATNISARSQEEKTSLIRQVLMLSDDQIAQCTPEQRQSIILLKEHFAKQTGGIIQGRN